MTEASVSENSPDASHDHDREILILYATETGNSLDVAEQIAREALRRSFSVRLVSTDAYPLDQLIHETLVIFVLSTTGSGQEPRPMIPMWNMLLRPELPDYILEDLDFAVFGLGDSTYEKFCWAAKKLSRRLLSLGAREICTRGEADEQHPLGTDGTLDEWMPTLFDAVQSIIPSHADATYGDVNALPPPRIRVLSAGSSGKKTEVDKGCLESSANYHFATVKCNKRITATDWFQDVRHIEFETEDNIVYTPGDVAVIHPVTFADDVDSFLANTGWSDTADDEFNFSLDSDSFVIPETVPRQTSLRKLFTKYLDINQVPRRSFFKMLRHFTQDPLEFEKLSEFCSHEGAEDLYDYTTRVRRTIREVLAEFRTVRIPKEYIFDLFPLLRPRQFSIASSVKTFPKQIHLCVAIVRYKTKLHVIRRGVCTSYLAGLKQGEKLYVGLQRGFLRLPEDPTTPIVCIGPGTGIAPMRALISERVRCGSRENTLYFGCRSSSKDHHYGDEWRMLVDSQSLVYRTSFSRDGPEGSKRIYVQDLMSQDEKKLWELLGRRGGWLYISGSSNKMPTAVKNALQGAARHVGKMSDEEAQSFIKELQESGRLFEECWS